MALVPGEGDSTHWEGAGHGHVSRDAAASPGARLHRHGRGHTSRGVAGSSGACPSLQRRGCISRGVADSTGTLGLRASSKQAGTPGTRGACVQRKGIRESLFPVRPIALFGADRYLSVIPLSIDRQTESEMVDRPHSSPDWKLLRTCGTGLLEARLRNYIDVKVMRQGR